MKVSKLWIGTLVISSAAVVAGAVGAPEIVVEEPVRDFGTVVQGEKLNLHYRVGNRGDEALEISVRPTCGCTVVDHDRVIIGIDGLEKAHERLELRRGVGVLLAEVPRQ